MKGMNNLVYKLGKMADKAVDHSLSVGFINGATYPDGKSVASVAYFNEFGTDKIPSRPFFRRMIAKESPTWGGKLVGAVKHTNFNFKKSMELLANDVEGALRQSIIETNDPPNAPYTIEKKGFNKPLIDTSLMIKSITSEVK